MEPYGSPKKNQKYSFESFNKSYGQLMFQEPFRLFLI